MGLITGVGHYQGNDRLGQGGGADFHHFGVNDAFDVFGENNVFFFVVNFYPAAAASRPRELFGNSFHRNAGDIADNFRQWYHFSRVVGDMAINFVAYQKQIVFFASATICSKTFLG